MCQLLMRNPYMKFQNCISINFERTHGRTDGQKDGRTDRRTDAQTNRKQYALSTIPKLGALKTLSENIKRVSNVQV